LKPSEKDQGFYECRQNGIVGESVARIKLKMKKTSFLRPIKSFEAFPSETNDNSIQVEWENNYFSTNGTKHFIVVATKSKPSHNSEPISKTFECNKLFCRELLNGVEPFIDYDVTIQVMMTEDGENYFSDVSSRKMVKTGGCKPDVVANEHQSPGGGRNANYYQLDDRRVLIAFSFDGDKDMMCGEITHYHFISGHGVRGGMETHQTIRAFPLDNTGHVTDPMATRFHLFEGLKQNEQFWYAVRPETRSGYKLYVVYEHPSQSYHHKHVLDVQNRRERGNDCDVEKQNEIFNTRFHNKYLEITWNATGFLEQTKSLHFFVKSFKNHSSNLHFEVQSGLKKLQVPIKDIYDAYYFTVRALDENECIIVRNQVHFLGMNQPNVGEKVLWEAVDVKAASINVTWEYKPAVRDGDKTVDTFTICYKMSSCQNCTYATTKNNWLVVENLYPNTQYNFQLRANFQNSKNEQEFSLPVFSVKTTCPSHPFLASASLLISEEDHQTVARWSEPNITIMQNDFVYYDVVLIDKTNRREFFSKTFNSGEANSNRDSIFNKTMAFNCLYESEWRIVLNAHTGGCELFKLGGNVAEFYVKRDSVCSEYPQLPKIILGMPTNTSKWLFMAERSDSNEISDEPAGNLATILQVMVPVMVSIFIITIFALLMWKIVKNGNRNYFHKSIFCFNCMEKRNEAPLEMSKIETTYKSSRTSSSDLENKDKCEVNVRQPLVNIDNYQNKFLLQNENNDYKIGFIEEKLRKHESSPKLRIISNSVSPNKSIKERMRSVFGGNQPLEFAVDQNGADEVLLSYPIPKHSFKHTKELRGDIATFEHEAKATEA